MKKKYYINIKKNVSQIIHGPLKCGNYPICPL